MVVSLTETAYNTSEHVGYVTICAKIVMGTLGRSLNVYASTIDGTATGKFDHYLVYLMLDEMACIICTHKCMIISICTNPTCRFIIFFSNCKGTVCKFVYIKL